MNWQNPQPCETGKPDKVDELEPTRTVQPRLTITRAPDSANVDSRSKFIQIHNSKHMKEHTCREYNSWHGNIQTQTRRETVQGRAAYLIEMEPALEDMLGKQKDA